MVLTIVLKFIILVNGNIISSNITISDAYYIFTFNTNSPCHRVSIKNKKIKININFVK